MSAFFVAVMVAFVGHLPAVHGQVDGAFYDTLGVARNATTLQVRLVR